MSKKCILGTLFGRSHHNQDRRNGSDNMVDAVFKLKWQLFREHVLRRGDVANYLRVGYEIKIRSHASGGGEFGLKLINYG